MESLVFCTKKKREVVDITDKIQDALQGLKADNGICHLFLVHTTAALTTADLDPDTDLDILDFFEAMIPKLRFRHPHNPCHFPSHMLSSLVGTSLCLLVSRSKLVLGTWQRIVLVEFDGPRERKVFVSFVEEMKEG